MQREMGASTVASKCVAIGKWHQLCNVAGVVAFAGITRRLLVTCKQSWERRRVASPQSHALRGSRGKQRQTEGRHKRRRSSVIQSPTACGKVIGAHSSRFPLGQLHPSLAHSSTMFRSALSKASANVAPRASHSVARPALARGYHEKVISHYERPRNVGSSPRAWTHRDTI